jgi:hypothetical protein
MISYPYEKEGQIADKLKLISTILQLSILGE